MQARLHALSDFRSLLWCVPYLLIWSMAGGELASVARDTGCTGFCALYVGSVTYATVAAAVALTALVAAVQLLVFSR